MWHFDIWENKRCNSIFILKPWSWACLIVLWDLWSRNTHSYKTFENKESLKVKTPHYSLNHAYRFDNHFGEIDWVILRKLSSFIVFFPADQVFSFEYHLQKCSSNYSKEDFVGEISLNMEMEWYFVIQIKEIWSAILSLDIRDKIIL